METTIEQNAIEAQPGNKELDAALTEALHEFELSRERMKMYDLAFEASQAHTRLVLDQLFAQLGLV